MPHLAEVTLRILASSAGCALLYATFFLYEDEKGRLQNVLEALWIRLEDMQSGIVPLHTAFMLEVSRIATKFYDKLFGKKLISRRAFSVSICYSIASFSIFGLILFQIPGVSAKLVPAISARTGVTTVHDMIEILSIAAIFYIALGTYPAFVKPSKIKDWLEWINKLALLPVLGISFIKPEVFKEPVIVLSLLKEPWRWFILLLLLSSFLCDVAVIIITRSTLRWCSDLPSFSRVAGMVFINLLLGIMLVITPLALPLEGKILSGLNIIDLIAASVFILIAILMLLHKAFGPMLSRALYPLVTSREKSKFYMTCGWILLLYGMGLLHGWSETLMRIFK